MLLFSGNLLVIPTWNKQLWKASNRIQTRINLPSISKLSERQLRLQKSFSLFMLSIWPIILIPLAKRLSDGNQTLFNHQSLKQYRNLLMMMPSKTH